MAKYLGVALILVMVVVLAGTAPLGPVPAAAQEQAPQAPRPLLRPEREERPGVAAQTGREALTAAGPSDRTGRSAEPTCPPPDERTGRGRICRPAGELPPVSAPERPTTPTQEARPERPTGLEPGDYPKAFPPYGTTGTSPPPPYGPGLGGRTVGP